MTDVKLVNAPSSGRTALSNLKAGEWCEWLGDAGCVLYNDEDVEGVIVALCGRGWEVMHLTDDTQVQRIESPTRVTVVWDK